MARGTKCCSNLFFEKYRCQKLRLIVHRGISACQDCDIVLIPPHASPTSCDTTTNFDASSRSFFPSSPHLFSAIRLTTAAAIAQLVSFSDIILPAPRRHSPVRAMKFSNAKTKQHNQPALGNRATLSRPPAENLPYRSFFRFSIPSLTGRSREAPASVPLGARCIPRRTRRMTKVGEQTLCCMGVGKPAEQTKFLKRPPGSSRVDYEL